MTLNPTTLCEVTYDVEWFDHPQVIPLRAASSAKSHQSGRPQTLSVHSGVGEGKAEVGLCCGQSGDTASVVSAVPSFPTYYDYMKNYYWGNPVPDLPGGASSSPSLPTRPHSTLTWYGAAHDDLPARNERNVLSLPSIPRAVYHGDDFVPTAEERRLLQSPQERKLKWVDALNAWVPDKKPTYAQPFISIINAAPRVERYMSSREGLHKKRHDEAQNRRLQRKSYSTPLYDPESLRRSRRVRFEAPRTASNTPQPIILPEQIEVPQPVWGDETTTLEGKDAGEDTADAHPPEPVPEPPPKSPSPQPEPPSNAKLKPKPPQKKEKPVFEKIHKPQKPKPEKPPTVAAPPKPAKQPKPVKPVKQLKQPKPKPEPKEKKIIPKPAPKALPPVRTPRTPRTLVHTEDKEPSDKLTPLPISPPEEVIKPPEPLKEEPPPPADPAPVPHTTRAPVKKKEKLPPPPPRRKTPSPPPKPPTPHSEHKDRGDWIYDDSDKEEEPTEVKKEVHVTLYVPTLPPALPDLKPHSAKSGAGRGSRSSMAVPLVAMKTKPRWGQRQKDSTLTDEEERERLAEERRRRHQDMMAGRHKAAKAGHKDHANHDGPNFDDFCLTDDSTLDGFLAKYCIMTPSATDKYRYTFDHMDEGDKGYLTEEETACGLRAINPSLGTSERNYLFRILEIAGHKMSKGTDFMLFAILAALSQRVLKLDEWAKNLMAELDYKHLERKLFLCRTLWECNVDEDTNTISLDQLIVELRAGGVSPQHEREVRKKLANLRRLDFFDFLMYVPLFITIHESVVSDPLSDSRSF